MLEFTYYTGEWNREAESFKFFYAKPLNIPAACRIAEKHIVNIVQARTTFFLLGSGTEEQHIYYS